MQKKSAKNKDVRCPYKESTTTTNTSIKKFLNTNSIEEIIDKSKNPIIFFYDENNSDWILSENGTLRLIFQTEENNYQPRSFEDSFICNNLQFIFTNKDKFVSLKNRNKITSNSTDFYDIAENCINSKTAFALDILLYGSIESNDWKIPLYIEEGLKWLAQ